jgi:hypothetical protein
MHQIFRLNRLYNRKDSEGNCHDGVFGVGRTKFLEDYVLRDAADPLIPGTDVPRMELVPLGERAQGATDIEIKRVMEGLQRCAQRKRVQVTV